MKTSSRFIDPEDMVEIGGPRGTIFAEDTRGLHKGKHLLTGDRLLFQLEFSNSLFWCHAEQARC